MTAYKGALVACLTVGFWAAAAAEQAAFEAQIAAAGGLQAWKKLEPKAAEKPSHERV